MRRLALLAALIASACGTADAAAPRGLPAASSLTITPAPLVTPTYAPGPSFVSGRIERIALPLVTIASYEDRDGHPVPVSYLVDTAGAPTVWRETWVTAAALRVGDDVLVGGASGIPLRAANIHANIGRLDGTIAGIAGDVLTLAVTKNGATFPVEAELSPFIVHEGPWRMSDLRPGMTVGAVVYWDRLTRRRITRIWW